MSEYTKKILMTEYEKWLEISEKQSSADTAFEFLTLRQAFREFYELPHAVISNEPASYVLAVDLMTDGDFRCTMQDPRLRHEDCSEAYTLTVAWQDEDQAVQEAAELLQQMRDSISTSRKSVLEILDDFFARAIRAIQEDCIAQEDLGGNYEGSRIAFTYAAQ